MANPPKFDVLTATGQDLQVLLQQGKLYSVDIIETYLDQIEAHNRQGLNLRAIAAVTPRDIALQQAQKLDEERKAGRVRSALHGLPIIVKDVIVTGPELGMPTTAGAVAFETAAAKQNARIIDRLMDAGLIILGKASMSEYTGSHELPAGYSASNGQTQSPYIRGGRRTDDGIAGRTSSGGSSAGAGAGAAAGFVPISIGTDTVGSVVLPANRASLYSMKLPSDSVPMDGVFCIARGWDSFGPMTKSAKDMELLTEIIQNKPLANSSDANPKDFLQGLKIGFVDFEQWKPICAYDATTEDLDQMKKDYTDAVETLRRSGSVVTYPIPFVLNDEYKYEGKTHNDVMAAEGRENFEAFTNCFKSTPVRTIEELIKFNEENKERAMPLAESSNDVILRWSEDTTSSEEKQKWVEQMVSNSRKVLDDLFEDFDVILLPADCAYASLGSAARYPFGTVPLGYLSSVGMPQGLTVGVGRDREDLMIRFMKGFEANFPKRRPPPQLQ